MSSRAHQPSEQAAPSAASAGREAAPSAEQPYGNQAAAEDIGLAVRDYLESQGVPPAQLDEAGLPAWLSEDEELPEPERMHFGEAMLLAATTLPHFLVALVDGLGASLDGDTLDAVHDKLAEGSLVAATVGMPWYLAGIVEGVAREVRDLVTLPLELPDLLLATQELIDLLSGPAGSEVARA